MGIQTTADDHRDAALNNIQEAIRNISKIVIEECWGLEEYKKEYQETLSDVLSELIKMRGRL